MIGTYSVGASKLKGRTCSHILTAALCGLLALAPMALADELKINYLDDDSELQVLNLDINAPESNKELAAALILQGFAVWIMLDGNEDLEALAESIAAHAPDEATADAVRNTILGVAATLPMDDRLISGDSGFTPPADRYAAGAHGDRLSAALGHAARLCHPALLYADTGRDR